MVATRSVDPAVPAGLNCFLLSEYVELWHAQSWGEKKKYRTLGQVTDYGRCR